MKSNDEDSIEIIDESLSPMEHLAHILKSDRRTGKEMKAIGSLVRTIQFFSKCYHILTANQYWRMVSTLQYERVSKNRFLYHKGDKGNKFYVILSGQAIVFVPKDDQQRKHVSLSKAQQKYVSRLIRWAAPGSDANSELPSGFLLPSLHSLPSFKMFAASRANSHIGTRYLEPTENSTTEGAANPIVRKSAINPLRVLKQGLEIPEEPSDTESRLYDEKFKEFAKNCPRGRSKLSKGKSILGYAFMKKWIDVFSKQQVDQTEVFLPYKPKRYWLNLFMCGLSGIDQETFKLIFPHLQVVWSYSAGGSFGELAILKGGIRRAGIYCTQDTEFGVLSKSGENTFEYLYKALQKDKEDALKYFKPFNYWINRDITSRLFHLLQQNSHTRNHLFYSKGDPVTDIFLLIKGEVEITLKEQIQKESKLQMTMGTNPYPSLQFRRIVSAPYIFGVEELIYYSVFKTRIFQAVVTSTDCTVFQISSQSIFSDLKPADKDFIKHLSEYSCMANPNLPQGIGLAQTDIRSTQKALINKHKLLSKSDKKSSTLETKVAAITEATKNAVIAASLHVSPAKENKLQSENRDEKAKDGKLAANGFQTGSPEAYVARTYDPKAGLESRMFFTNTQKSPEKIDPLDTIREISDFVKSLDEEKKKRIQIEKNRIRELIQSHTPKPKLEQPPNCEVPLTSADGSVSLHQAILKAEQSEDPKQEIISILESAKHSRPQLRMNAKYSIGPSKETSIMHSRRESREGSRDSAGSRSRGGSSKNHTNRIRMGSSKEKDNELVRFVDMDSKNSPRRKVPTDLYLQGTQYSRQKSSNTLELETIPNHSQNLRSTIRFSSNKKTHIRKHSDDRDSAHFPYHAEPSLGHTTRKSDTSFPFKITPAKPAAPSSTLAIDSIHLDPNTPSNNILTCLKDQYRLYRSINMARMYKMEICPVSTSRGVDVQVRLRPRQQK